MSRRTKKQDTDLIEKLMPCIRDNCPVQTKAFVPSSFDCSPTFLCGFCAASIKSYNQKTYSSAVTNSIRNEQQTRATLFAEVQQEQARKDAKKMNLVVKGTKPSDLKTDASLVQELAKTLDVKIEAHDVELKRIGKPQESTGHQLLLLKFREQMKRKEFLRKSGNLRKCRNFSSIYVSPDLTRAERVQQYNLRIKKRQLESQNPGNTYRIRWGRVCEEK